MLIKICGLAVNKLVNCSPASFSLVDHLGIEFIEVQDADLGAQGFDVLDDFVGLRLTRAIRIHLVRILERGSQMHSPQMHNAVWIPKNAEKALRSDNAPPGALPAPPPAEHIPETPPLLRK